MTCGRMRLAWPIVAIALLLAPSTSNAGDAAELSKLEQQFKDIDTRKHLGRYRELIPIAEKIVEIADRSQKPFAIVQYRNRLARLYIEGGLYVDAESLLKSTLEFGEKTIGKVHSDFSESLRCLAALYQKQERYGAAEQLYLRTIDINEQVDGKVSRSVANVMRDLAVVYFAQGRVADAEPLFFRSLTIKEQLLGKPHPFVTWDREMIAKLYVDRKRYSDAAAMYNVILAHKENENDPFYIASLVPYYQKALAQVYILQGRYADAETLYSLVLAYEEGRFQQTGWSTGPSLIDMASIKYSLGKSTEAMALLDRAFALYEKDSEQDRDWSRVSSARDRHRSLALRAQIAWKRGQRREAIADLKLALDVANQHRSTITAGDRERAESFASFAGAFEQMVEWQTVVSDAEEGLEAVERSRARSLQDQMKARDVDLLAGLPADQAARLQQREDQAVAKITEIEKELRVLHDNPSTSAAQVQPAYDRLIQRLKLARDEHAIAYAEIRARSPAHKLAVGQNEKPVALGALQEWVSGQNGLLLEYLIGESGGYVIVVPSNGKPRIDKLTLTEEQAQILGVAAGPVTAARLHDIFATKEKNGILQLLGSPGMSGLAATKLAALWPALIPDAERSALKAGMYQRLFVIPDGELAAFPFESLIAERIGEPEYLLDFGPPIIYAPSATILYNLEQRMKSASLKPQPIISIGVANYYGGTSVNADGALALSSTRSKVRRAGIELIDLPGTAAECDWVRQNFQQAGIDSSVLFDADANEDNVRRELPGRRLVHLACHGFVDESPGNLFGALALAPSKSDDPVNDGFLTLAEIYGMNLAGCELTLLSACETNLGPQQKGEGSLALSRGFLVAGSRRVIASNWLVSDEAAPTMVSYLTALIAQAEKEGRQPDYAVALQEAKRAVRQNPKWKDPFFWAPMVLVGPK